MRTYGRVSIQEKRWITAQSNEQVATGVVMSKVVACIGADKSRIGQDPE